MLYIGVHKPYVSRRYVGVSGVHLGTSISGRPIGCQPFSAIQCLLPFVASALEISPRVPILPIEEEGG